MHFKLLFQAALIVLSIVPASGQLRSSIAKENITFSVINPGRVMRINLQEPLKITAVIWKQQHLPFEKKDKNSYLLTFPQELTQ
ncbi:hypothetical protein [Chitinophaga filiformis]|uniref:Uncharacterized protein n=1 Tax=Chitinophaga filiformis TaxID=104663 RepID=A0A1G7H0C7_CHIFI|nr:hypothetical protein [Chitinophaga filiformis]SDE93858.1 hypothetical protein SAMN04488121_101246 [Chitinophaga filiformis]